MKHTSLFQRFFSVGFLTILSASALSAQTSQSGLAPTLPASSAAAYYYIAKPGELTMQVNIWGFVQKPGRYEVASSTDLIQVISFAGGPADYAKMDEVKITRIVKSDSAVSKREIVVDLERLVEVEDSELVLHPGDTIFIGHTAWLTIRDAFSAVATAAIIATAIAQVVSLNRR
jgi:hypothetical protein